MRSICWLAAGLPLLAGCARQPVLPDPPVAAAVAPAAAPAARPAVGDFGLDLAGRDLKVRPGDDFFRYANGTWYDGFSIPGDHASYGTFYELEDRSAQRVRQIIERAAAAHAAPGSPE